MTLKTRRNIATSKRKRGINHSKKEEQLNMSSLRDTLNLSYQFLVRFRNKTHVINLPNYMNRDEYNNFDERDDFKNIGHENTSDLSELVLFRLSCSINIPSYLLTFSSSSFQTLTSLRKERVAHQPTSTNANTIVTFLTARLHPSFSSILGGKGGFGTLLKSQSKKAGAKTTLDFGACRDLNGRRLRHVNDEIKLRKWRSNLNNSGEEEENVAGWHLDLPGWARNEAGSEKVRKRNEMKFRRERQREEEEREIKKRKKEAEVLKREQLVMDYADKPINDPYSNEGGMENAIKQGLKKRMKVEEDVSTKNIPNELESIQDNNANWFCALAGDIHTTFLSTDSQSNNKRPSGTYNSFNPTTYIVGKSEFSTVCVLRPNLHYFEVKLETCGLSQIGFADISSSANFAPNTDTGDGVGDDEFSYAFDISRNKVFHNYKEFKYPNAQKKKTGAFDDMNQPGNVIGCWYNHLTDEISFFLNGEDLGVAFSIKEKRKKSPGMQMIPAISLNQDEVIGLRIGPYFQFNPCVKTSLEPVRDMETAKQPDIKHISSSPSNSQSVEPSGEDAATNVLKNSEAIEIKKPAPTIPEHLDLSHYDSAESLRVLGLERLKSALLALSVKCGGSLEERAKRLYSLKDLKRSDYPKKVRNKHFIV